ncbi:group III truncated hemoglobin [Chelatococcus asaccharovorans]|uniref:group III truncated hemoglobin n=1 Tax=Chelatococcus asaccharovorans TaxID=28210 RepID=UPI00224C7B12|nr:group III truncated hemoglobin [Chelatococcus asaccharovorans]CAH1661403.1 Hemoglobin [Chelatococcus asaccharovorans]CAH1689788.1 Hemoglobin [Chelatococcus asaccharovorans]
MLIDERPTDLSESLVERLVHTFYGRIREDAVLGPIFEARLAGRWDAHLRKMVDFWSSIALKSGRYGGRPHVAHQGLGLEPAHFARWLNLFEKTVHDVCAGAAATLFIDRAHRIADSLQIGLNIGPHALHFPPRSADARDRRAAGIATDERSPAVKTQR